MENQEYQIWSMNISKKRDYDEAWNYFKQDSCIGIDYFLINKGNDYSLFTNKNELQEFLKDNIPEKSAELDLINLFVNQMNVGDILIAHKGRSTLAGIGRITSDYIFQDDYLKHVRKIEWIYTPDDLELKERDFFKPSNIVRLDEKNPKFINEIFARIAGKDKNVRKNLFEYLFKLYYNNYHTSKKGKEHYNTYNLEGNHIRYYWNLIDEKSSDKEIIDIIWNKIFIRPDSVLRVASRNLRNMNKERYHFTDEEIDESALLFYNTVNGILNTQSSDEQKRILNEFSQNKLSNGLGAGRLTPVLFYLNDSFYPINKKSVLTYKFMSLALGYESEISADLTEYIDNNAKYNELLVKLNHEFSCDKFDLGNIKVFDEFCHWICAEDDYLSGKDSKILPFDIINEVPDIEMGIEIAEEVKMFESDLKRNIIYFGAPGTGKSYNLNLDKKVLLENYPENYERVTFHPDYSYANFVGTYKPVPEGKDITYSYVPGPFMRILKKALENPDKPYLLIIEEINRANVAAVFGDVFQLLDRENFESVYPIDASEDMKTYINQNKISLPSNLFIWATMNSADQGVFPMDTAFKRRWDFKYFSINYDEDLIDDTHTILNDETIYWNDLRKQINDELLSYKINEDKLMGPFFAFNEFKGEEIPTETFKDIFKNKIIMYLFEDAAKSKRNDLFSGARGNKNYVTYSEICEIFDENGIEIFCDNIKNRFLDENEEY